MINKTVIYQEINKPYHLHFLTIMWRHAVILTNGSNTLLPHSKGDQVPIDTEGDQQLWK